MEDFFKQFRNNVERRPEPKMEAQDWQDMQARLDKDGQKRPAAFLWWWLSLPLLLLLTGSNIFFFWQWKNAAQHIERIEIQRDTVFRTRVVYTTDTIYRTRTRYTPEQTQRNIYTKSRLHEKDFQDLEQGSFTSGTRTNADSSTQRKPNRQQGTSTLQGEKITGSLVQDDKSPLNEKQAELQALAQTRKPLSHTEIRRLDNLRAPLQLPQFPVLATGYKRRKTLSDHLYFARPKGVQMGVKGGMAYPFGAGLDFKSGYSIGLHAAVEFSPSLRLWADAAYLKTLFLTNRMGDDIGVPVESAPSDEYVFIQAEAPQPFFQYSAGMQYLFGAQRRLKPFVGIGIGAISLLPYDVIYEFNNTALNVEWNLDKTVYRNGLITNFLVLPAGLEYRFSKHWNGQFQLVYRYNWKGSGVQAPNMLGIQGGLNYHF